MQTNAWSQQELEVIKSLDLRVARLVSDYLGGPLETEALFVPTKDNLSEMDSKVSQLLSEINRLEDPFWKSHFTAALESLSFQIQCNTKMPYEYITRISSSLDKLMMETGAPGSGQEVETALKRLRDTVAVIQAIDQEVHTRTDLAKSQLADVLPSLSKNVQRCIDFVQAHAATQGAKDDAQAFGNQALEAIRGLQSKVKPVYVGELEPVDIPFAISVEKGMQVPLDYLLSWYEEDAVNRRKEYFEIAEADFPGQDPNQVLMSGQGYATVEELFADMRQILDLLQEECTRFVDLPEDEYCDIGLIPETWRMMVPGFMYLGGLVAINPDNLASYRRVGLETTAVHEVYPGHHVHSVKSAQHALPHTFKLGLFWSRCLQEGMCDRSMVLMTPYLTDPAAKLSVAKRLWFTASRAKAEVDIYYNKKSVQEIIDNYMNNLGLPSYNAHAQTRAHLMRPADAISYYTGMKYLDDLYNEAGLGLKEFTNEIFSYGSIPLATMKHILALPEEKKQQIRTLTAQ